MITSITLITIILLTVWSINLSCGIKINFLSFWIFSYVVFIAVGVILIDNKIIESNLINPVHSSNFEMGFIFLIYGGVTPLILFYGLSLIQPDLIRSIVNPKFFIKKNKEDFGLQVLAIIFIISSTYYLFIIHPSPLYLAMCAASSQEVALRRLEITKSFNESGVTQIASISILLSYLCVYACIFRISFLKSFSFFSAFISLLGLAVLVSNGEKAPLINFLIGAIISYCLGKGKLPVLGAKIIAFILFIIIIQYYLFMADGIDEIIGMIIERIFIAQQAAVYLSLDYYKDFSGVIGFNSLKTIFHKILNIKSDPVAAEVLMEVYFPDILNWGGWNINGIYIYEAWANFGIFGVIVSPFLVFLLNFFVVIFVVRDKNSAFSPALYAFLSSSCPFYLTSFSSYIYSNYTVIIIFFYFIYKLANGAWVEKKHSYI